MSFWTTSAGTSATENVEAKGTYEAPGGNSDPLPDNSSVLAFVEKAGWAKGRDDDGNPEYINLQWRVEQPESVARSVVFQKLWVTDADPNAKDATAKRDKALAMLAKIDAIAGGKLAKIEGKPTDDQLTLALQNKAAVLKLGLWEIEEGGVVKASGNWVKAISPKGEAELSVPGGAARTGGGFAQDDLDDDIPF